METFIRTSDMPGVHQLNDVPEVMPSDYEMSPIVHSTNERSEDPTGRVLSVNPDLQAARLHASYNDIIEAVNKCMETGAGIVWDTYQAYIKLKSSNQAKYDDAIKQLEANLKNSLFCPFHTRLNNLTTNKKVIENLDKPDAVEVNDYYRKFVTNILGTNANCDIPNCISRKSYLDSIAELRYQLQAIKSNFKFDIENCIEYTVHRKDCLYSVNQLSSIAFKVKPYLEKVSTNTENPYEFSIPVVGYKVCIDMHKLVIWMFTNCKMPDELPEALESIENVKEEYVKSIVGEYPSLAEKIARRIVMELYDAYYNVQGNWGNFLKRFIGSYNRMISDPDLANLIDKVKYFADLSSTHNDPAMIEVSDSCNNDLLTDILKRINTIPSDDEVFTTQLYSAISNDVDSNKGEYIINQATVLFKKTFSIFFEDAVLLNFEPIYQNEHYSKKLTLTSYAREFNRIYDVIDLLGKASSISNYNTRDFMQTLIGEVKQLKCSTYDPTKLVNGELAFFMYSKYSRNIWMTITNSVILASKLVGMIDNVLPRKTDALAYDKVKQTLNRFVDHVYSNLFRIIGEARYIPQRMGYCYLSSDSFVQGLKLKHFFNFCKAYSLPPVMPNHYKIDDLIKTKQKADGFEANECFVGIEDSYITSYDVTDLESDYALKNNFKLALKQRDVIGYDF